MARYASGKQAWGYSDRSGFRYRLADMLTEWSGAKVGPDEYEAKHPQLEPIRPGPDPQALHDPRPDQRTEVPTQQLLPPKPFVSGDAGTAVITVIEPSHGRSSSDTSKYSARQSSFGTVTQGVLENASGYSITVVDENTYTFTASSGTATSGSTRGGGNNATAGPVTLEN